MPQIVNTEGLFNLTVTKTKGIYVIPVKDVVNCLFESYFRLNTLEGIGPVEMDKCLCIAHTGEAWLQTTGSLQKNYTFAETLENGTSLYIPKPENEREAFFLTEDEVQRQGLDSRAPLYIVGAWGEEINGVKNLQRIEVGDPILRNKDEHSDQWRVTLKLFNGTYNIKTTE
jgi:hypothetical protein